MRNVVLILSLLLWFLFGWWSCNYHNKCCTDGSGSLGDTISSTTEANTDGSSSVAKSMDLGPLLYRYNSSDAITTDKWETRKAEILEKLQKSQKLEITGLYRSDEVNSTSFPDLGIARADAARLQLGLENNTVILSSRLIEGVSDPANPFEACEFDYRIITENIVETADRTVIRFPFNSTNKLNSEEVETYLNEDAQRVIASGEKIVLTGHTDNVGDEASNLALAKRRADVVRSYLISKGVNSGSITSSSLGESQPIADNSTETGRQQNRRTELQIIK